MANHTQPNHSYLVPQLNEWLATRQRASLMERGQTMAPSTARAERNRICQAAKRANGEPLPSVLADRARVEALLSRLHDELAPATARNAVKAFVSYAEYLATQGAPVHVSATDIPRRAKLSRKLVRRTVAALGLVLGPIISGLVVAEVEYDHHPPSHVVRDAGHAKDRCDAITSAPDLPGPPGTT